MTLTKKQFVRKKSFTNFFCLEKWLKRLYYWEKIKFRRFGVNKHLLFRIFSDIQLNAFSTHFHIPIIGFNQKFFFAKKKKLKRKFGPLTHTQPHVYIRMVHMVYVVTGKLFFPICDGGRVRACMQEAHAYIYMVLVNKTGFSLTIFQMPIVLVISSV